MAVGIEAINVYPGRASLPVFTLFAARQLDMSRFDNLMMRAKSVNLPCEDPVTNAVNAGKPLIDALTPDERGSIELIVVGTESGLDYGKPNSTYIHDILDLPRNCRSFEVKHACYGGTAALQTAAALVQASPRPGAKALVIAADSSNIADRNTYWEPSQGAGAVAMIVSRDPAILDLDMGANGYYSHEVMDTLRPRADLETGDSDLSLLSYLNCLQETYAMYCRRVESADWQTTFRYLVFHAPFAGMVKGAHRSLSRRLSRATTEQIDADFASRLLPSLHYTSLIGNTYSASVYVGLCALINRVRPTASARIGVFSYGSGCASEFYSGVLQAGAAGRLDAMDIDAAVQSRYELAMDEYEVISDLLVRRLPGVEDAYFGTGEYAAAYDKCMAGQGLLVLDRIDRFHREYRWS